MGTGLLPGRLFLYHIHNKFRRDQTKPWIDSAKFCCRAINSPIDINARYDTFQLTKGDNRYCRVLHSLFLTHEWWKCMPKSRHFTNVWNLFWFRWLCQTKYLFIFVTTLTPIQNKKSQACITHLTLITLPVFKLQQ